MESEPQEIRLYETGDARAPFKDWVRTLGRRPIYGIILNRLDRVEKGLFGVHHAVGEGVSELVVDWGPGYRIYFGRMGNNRVILLWGGTKARQQRDIAIAKKFWRDFHAAQD